jgi:hypothetical protein
MLADFVENDGDGIANGHFANSEPMRDSSADPATSFNPSCRRQIVSSGRAPPIAITDEKNSCAI